jgi:hypothetical protein
MRPVGGCEAGPQSAKGPPATPSQHQTGDTGPSRRGQPQSSQPGTAWLCGRPEDGTPRPHRLGDDPAAPTRSFQPRPRCWKASAAALSCLPCWPSAAPRRRWQPWLGHGSVHPPTAAADRVCVLDTRKGPRPWPVLGPQPQSLRQSSRPQHDLLAMLRRLLTTSQNSE